MAEEQNNFDKQFISDSLSYESYAGPSKTYSGSEQQIQTYENLYKKDINYKRYIDITYGSFENYKTLNKTFRKGNVYDPTVDHILDVTVITEEHHYKTDHISASEIIMESASGICSYYFIKKDGSTTKVNGTLDNKYIPVKEWPRRMYFFSPLPGERVVVWDINKQRWSSFYMNNIFKFVRDDTTDLE